MADIQAIAEQFTNYYYQTFDQSGKDRSSLTPLYRENSMLSWEGEQIMGNTAIIAKLNSLPFEKVQHKVTTSDAQPSSATVASLIVLVTGQLIVDDSPQPMPYSQTFQLVPDENGGYYVQNDVFRL
ncbi:nuclear transport factor 2 [Filobasidium floriforme]|uniref:nuclear transport factor 2 n=1 Tax=Filobasidium floriforme TaxID=5210 RepID=UPI001E8D40BE|nr:nuclear transport factor 2 [Filobasidium floriforme]KAH8085207.1 nuclear transport factor 2 [Filobasidium floriforme]